METIVNNPSGTRSGSGMGTVVGIVFIALLTFLFLIYGLPMIRQASNQAQVNVPENINVSLDGAK